MCFDVSIPIRLICSTDGLLCLRSATMYGAVQIQATGRSKNRPPRRSLAQNVCHQNPIHDMHLDPFGVIGAKVWAAEVLLAAAVGGHGETARVKIGRSGLSA